MLAAFHLNLTALSWVALVVGLFLVYNTVTISVIARREEIGTLRALGVTRRQVLALFLGEAAVLGLAGASARARARPRAGRCRRRPDRATVSTLYIADRGRAAGAHRLARRRSRFAIGLPLSLLAALVPALEAQPRAADRRDARPRSARVAAPSATARR